jgi:hypothetical protein
MDFTNAAFLAPIVLSFIEAAIKKALPSLEAAVAKYLPEVEAVVDILVKGDPATVKAELLALQRQCVDAAVDAELAKLK